MDKVSTYLEIVPLPVLMGAPFVVLLVFFIIPGRYRLEFFLGAMTLTLCTGRLPDLGVLSAVAKVGSSVAILMVALAAAMDPGPKRPLSMWTLLYLIMALLGFVFIITTSNIMTAAALRMQWLLVVIAAALTARTVVDEQSLLRIGRALTIGFSLSLLLPLAALLRDPGSAFIQGLGRFEPWGAGANHIGVMFALTTALCLMVAWLTRRVVLSWAFLGLAALAGGMGIMTASRSTVVIMFGMTLPVAIKFIKKPFILMSGGVIVGVALVWLLGFSDPGSLDRLGSMDTDRAQTAERYLDTVISERPLLGLLESTDESVLGSEDVGMHPHNAYIETAYLGGIVYALPMFTLVAITIFATIAVWKRRREMPFDPIIINFMSMMMMMVYAHGFVNGAIYYPTYTWSFIHVFLSITLITWARDIRNGESLLMYAAYTAWDDGYSDQPFEYEEYDPQHAPTTW